MLNLIISLIKSLGSEVLVKLLSEIINLLSKRDDNTIGAKSVNEVEDIIKRNVVKKVAATKLFRRR